MNVIAQQKPVKLLHLTTVPQTLNFLTGAIGFTKARGFEVHVVSSPGLMLDEFAAHEDVIAHPVLMMRRITPFHDCISIFKLVRVMRRVNPAIVHAHTPKAGILGMIGTRLARVPVRIYHIHGLPFMTAKGYKRVLLRLSEKVSCLLAQKVLCVSESIREVAIVEGLCPASKIEVLLSGSIGGIDSAVKFNPLHIENQKIIELRKAYAIPDDAQVVGFVGRIVRDKGLVELVEAWKALRKEYPALHLLLVGPIESQDPVPASVEQVLKSDPRIHLMGRQRDVPPFYAAMDILVLPTYREGFPYAPLEAAAMAIPVVATRIPGCIDAVQDGITGTLVAPRDATALAAAIRAYLNDSDLRQRHGSAGRQRVLRDFRQETIWEATYNEYVRLLQEKQLVALPMDDGYRDNIPRADRNSMGRVAKRLFDLVGSIVGLIVLAPLLTVIAVLVRLFMGSPILFRQERPGFKGRLFVLYKFRTMRDLRDIEGNLLPSKERLTKFGRFLRSTSLDELPELFNVVKGDMSLVGPRPLLVKYLDRYTPEQTRRHNVKPGITGWAQVNGRNALSWEEKFIFDVWYVDNWSMLLDIKILLITAIKVFKREGISAEGFAAMPDFIGTKKN